MQRWLLVSDIHLDPFFQADTYYGAGDTTPRLWRSALAAMRADVPDARVVIVGGDLMAHEWKKLATNAGADPTVSAVATTREIAGDLAADYPRAQFLVTLGNNDDPCGDYRGETGGPYLAALTHIWKPLVQRNGAAPDFAGQFGRGGYYTAALPNGDRAIVLDSVFWSLANGPGCESTTHGAAAAEQRWLVEQLEALPRNVRAMVLMHVPPGYDSQVTGELHDVVAVPYFSPSANAALLAVFAHERHTIAFALGAHTHRYDFRIVSGVPMMIGSSISPVYGNNPAFYELDIDAHGDLRDVVPYVFDPYSERWERHPSFDSMYGVAAPDAAALNSIAGRIRTDVATRRTWIAAHDAWAIAGGGGGTWWFPDACAQTELDGGFASCAGVVRVQIRIAATLAGIAAVLVIAWLTLRGKRRT